MSKHTLNGDFEIELDGRRFLVMHSRHGKIFHLLDTDKNGPACGKMIGLYWIREAPGDVALCPHCVKAVRPRKRTVREIRAEALSAAAGLLLVSAAAGEGDLFPDGWRDEDLDRFSFEVSKIADRLSQRADAAIAKGE